MTRHTSAYPFSIEDMTAAQMLLATPPGYQPQIDTTTRQVLAALLQDIRDHRDTWHDPDDCEDARLSAQFIAELLADILNRTEETHGISHSLPGLR